MQCIWYRCEDKIVVPVATVRREAQGEALRYALFPQHGQMVVIEWIVLLWTRSEIIYGRFMMLEARPNSNVKLQP